MGWKTQLAEAFPNVKFQMDEEMKRHTTFRIGGPAEVYAEPGISDAKAMISYCKRHRLPYTILGNGSNVLVSDSGISGVVISFGRPAAKIRVKDDLLVAEAGALLSQVARVALEAGFTGLEFAAGIPGTIGGAMMMNAGAYGGEMKDVVQSVEVILADGSVRIWEAEELDLSYRHSKMMEEEAIVLSATLRLQKGDKETIQATMDDFRNRRLEKQPLEFPSAGSTFKRPKGYFAGKLIMDAGLAGYQVGGAAVSKKHCGFVINEKDATAADVYQLIQDVIRTVQDKYDVTLEPEVRFLGEF